jgi:hypothetical protein
MELSEQRKEDIATYVASCIWPLNPTGSLAKTIDTFIDTEKNRAPEYVAETIGAKYIDYFNKWQNEHDGQEEKYIGKDDKLLDAYSFLIKRGYMQEYAIAKKSRDFYLFGLKSKDELTESLNAFNTKMSHGRK